jgi:hypothetical protein
MREFVTSYWCVDVQNVVVLMCWCWCVDVFVVGAIDVVWAKWAKQIKILVLIVSEASEKFEILVVKRVEF